MEKPKKNPFQHMQELDPGIWQNPDIKKHDDKIMSIGLGIGLSVWLLCCFGGLEGVGIGMMLFFLSGVIASIFTKGDCM